MSRKYNPIYNILVEGNDDILGNIAYSLYKSEKIQFIERYKHEHQGEEPDEDEFKRFHDFVSTDAQIEKYQMQAADILASFLENTLSSQVDEIEKATAKKHKSMIENAMNKFTLKGFCIGVLQGVVAAIVSAIIFAAFVFSKNIDLSTQKYTITFGGDGNITPSMELVEKDSIKSQNVVHPNE